MPAPSLNGAEPPGWFGKLPCVGDFASRRLPPAFVRPWDRWLAQGLATAQAELGEAWLDGYLVAPILRFWLAPGLLDTGCGWAGLVMPSVDRVGRHYPLTLAAPAEAAPEGPAAALGDWVWFDALDATAREVLEPDCSIDLLETRLRELAPCPAPAPSADDTPPALAGRLATLWAEPQPPACLWWQAGDPVPERLRAYPALPPPEAFVALLEFSG